MIHECHQYGIKLWVYGGATADGGFRPWAFDLDGVIDCTYGGDQGAVPTTVHDGRGLVYVFDGSRLTSMEYERRGMSLTNVRYARYLERLLRENPNPEIRSKLYSLQYDIKAHFYGPRYGGANIYQWRSYDDEDGSADIPAFDKKRKALMRRMTRFLKTWKGKMAAGKGARHEYEVLKDNLGKKPPVLSDFNIIRRQLVDWILEVRKK